MPAPAEAMMDGSGEGDSRDCGALPDVCPHGSEHAPEERVDGCRWDDVLGVYIGEVANEGVVSRIPASPDGWGQVWMATRRWTG